VADLFRLGRELSRSPRPRRLLVQWVPHAYGWRSLNLPFCVWLWLRSVLHGDRVEIMVHEPFLAWEGSWAQRVAALVHRLMTLLLLRSATRVWVSTPVWAARWKRYTLGKRVPFHWLPVPANVPVVRDPAEVAAVRAHLAPGGLLLGHFGTYGHLVTDLLEPALVRLLRERDDLSVVLLGRGSEGYRAALAGRHPDLARRVAATGALPAAELSLHLQACDLLLQPFPDGVTSRRGSVMAALAHGRPVVTTAGPLTEPLWATRGAVALAPAGDPAALADAAGLLLASREERARVGANGATLYDTVFSLERTLAALCGVAQ
jgi:glycosyltransferase involved in cell wall biosynthesis